MEFSQEGCLHRYHLPKHLKRWAEAKRISIRQRDGKGAQKGVCMKTNRQRKVEQGKGDNEYISVPPAMRYVWQVCFLSPDLKRAK